VHVCVYGARVCVSVCMRLRGCTCTCMRLCVCVSVCVHMCVYSLVENYVYPWVHACDYARFTNFDIFRHLKFSEFLIIFWNEVLFETYPFFRNFRFFWNRWLFGFFEIFTCSPFIRFGRSYIKSGSKRDPCSVRFTVRFTVRSYIKNGVITEALVRFVLRFGRNLKSGFITSVLVRFVYGSFYGSVAN